MDIAERAYHTSRSSPLNTTYLAMSTAVCPPPASKETRGQTPTMIQPMMASTECPREVSRRLICDFELMMALNTAAGRVIGTDTRMVVLSGGVC